MKYRNPRYTTDDEVWVGSKADTVFSNAPAPFSGAAHAGRAVTKKSFTCRSFRFLRSRNDQKPPWRPGRREGTVMTDCGRNEPSQGIGVT